MKFLSARTLIVLSLMAASIAASVYLRPVPDAESLSNLTVKLDTVIPEAVGDWRIDRTQERLVVSPDLQAALDNLYSDTLSRTYINSKGQRVMLSLAYGANQSRSLRVHKPETCYVAQGFTLTRTQPAQLKLDRHQVPALRLTARMGSRVEDITYWIRSGDDIVAGWVQQNVSTLRYGLQGRIPDGILVRISTIDSGAGDGSDFELQSQFLSQLLASASDDTRRILVGHKV